MKDAERKQTARKRLRKSVIEILGGECVYCGFNDERALQVDHIDGNGSKDRALAKDQYKYLKSIIQSVLNEENKYQLLCANCNWIKRHVNKEYN